jgi:hypothetical protein
MKTLAEIFAWLDISGCKGRNFSMEKYPIGYSWIRNTLKDEAMTDDLYVGLISVAVTELAKGFESATEDRRTETLAVIREGYFSYRHKVYCQTELATAIAAAKAEKERQEAELARIESEKAEKLRQYNDLVDAGADPEKTGAILFRDDWPKIKASLAPETAPETVPETVPETAKPASRARR